SELKPMIPYHHIESPARPAISLKRFYAKYTSRIGIRGAALIILSVLTLFLVFSKTPEKKHLNSGVNKLQKQPEATKSVASLIDELSMP
ncbi:unnamed protein product, partial [Allacma fusca]